MARWKCGESDVEALIASGELQKLTGDADNGDRLLGKAAVTLETARSAIDRDPDSAFVLAYDASRQALTALLAHQGLSPTTRGGHYAVEQAAARDSAAAAGLTQLRSPSLACLSATLTRGGEGRIESHSYGS